MYSLYQDIPQKIGNAILLLSDQSSVPSGLKTRSVRLCLSSPVHTEPGCRPVNVLTTVTDLQVVSAVSESKNANMYVC